MSSCGPDSFPSPQETAAMPLEARPRDSKGYPEKLFPDDAEEGVYVAKAPHDRNRRVTPNDVCLLKGTKLCDYELVDTYSKLPVGGYCTTRVAKLQRQNDTRSEHMVGKWMENTDEKDAPAFNRLFWKICGTCRGHARGILEEQRQREVATDA